MAHLILKEIEQDPFSVDSLIETLTYKSTDGRVGQTDFDPLILEETFKKTIEDLKKINEKSQQKIEALQAECQKEKGACKEKIVQLEGLYKDSYDHLAVLEKRISVVSSTMSDMGSQLENLNKPRLNLYESQKIAKYFDKFMEGIPNSGIFADDSKLEQAAEVIYKLHLLSNDLNDERFQKANELIEMKYNDIEAKLTQQFNNAFFRNDKKSMKKHINILSNFKGYQECLNEFIKNSQMSIANSRDVFGDVVPLCKKTNEIINEVFSNNERIMEQFVKDLFLGRIQVFINGNIEKHKDDIEKYLETIHQNFNKTKKIFYELSSIMKMSSDSNFFNKLLNDVFSVHLKDYASLEKTHLQNKFKVQMERFYEQIGHTKRNLQSGFVSNLLSKSSNQNEVIDDRFVSNDVATLSIDDAKNSLTRAALLCDPNAHPKLVEEIYEILCNHLFKEHLFYALDLHINALQSMDSKHEVKLHIFQVIKQLNDLFYLFEKFVNVTVLPAVNATTSYSKVTNRQKQICNDLESKIDSALEKTFTAICNHLRHILQTEQKKSDFKSDNNQMTNASSKVTKAVENYIGKLNSCLDGRNVNNALRELGIKFHRCIYDHVFRFEYNEMGAVALLTDINIYGSCAKNFSSPIVDKLFQVLCSLANLLVAKSSNLAEMVSEENLIAVNKETIESFIQLRPDYKTLKMPTIRANK